MLFLPFVAFAAVATTPSVFPLPNKMVSTGPDVQFRGFVVRADPALANEKAVAEEIWGRSKASAAGVLNLRLRASETELGQEGYHLVMQPGKVIVTAPTSTGVFYGLQTLRQLLHRSGGKLVGPQVQIADKPRFPWRGMMLDVSRHFFPKADILHFLDLLSQFKINTFHWHLNDDGGWRIEIKRYPKLTSTGAWRLPSDGRFPEYSGLSFPGPDSGQKQYGGFYTQEDVKEIVRYAETRHINIVPEIEMPGHNLAATMSYPELICDPKLREGYAKEDGLVFPNVYCAGKESTYTFVENVLDEVMALFPSKVIHIGGDEVDKYLWTRCDDCKKRMAELGMTSAAQLESYYVERIEKYLNAHGRQIIGWDEILEGGLAPNAKVMSWRGEEGGIAAAKMGHDVVMTPWDWCYFDHDNRDLTLETVLGYDPAPASRPELAGHVLGAQANIWTETLPKRANIEDRLFPRILAMAQILWTNAKEPNASFLSRLDMFLPTLYAEAPGLHLRGPSTPLSVVPPGNPISFDAPAIPGANLRYTLDGSDPDPGSPELQQPRYLLNGQVLSVALVTPEHRISDVTRVYSASMQPTSPESPEPGLVYRVFTGNFDKVPDFAALTPTASGVTPAVKIVGGLTEHYALEFTGYLTIPETGKYRLTVSSDDGSVVWLGGYKIIDNDGPHGAIGASAVLNLTAGDYPLTVGYYQGTEGQSVDLQIEGPGLTRQSVSPSLLRH